MASDGSQPVPWNGQAFPYLMHHSGFHQTENYGSKRSSGHGDSHHTNGHGAQPKHPASDRTGVWNGPAPRGYTNTPTHAQDEPVTAATAAVKEPESIVLRGGVRLPLIGLGTYAMKSADSVRAALAAGYRHIDCARIYENEATVGEGLKDFLAENEENRAKLWITSKVWNDAHRPEAVKASVQQTLADLGCGYLDLLLIHWPKAWIPGTEQDDTEVSLEDTWRAMEELVDAGLVKHLGVSNFGLKLVEEVLSFGRIKPVVNQVELHPLLPQRKLVGVCLRKGVYSVAYSPLGHSTRDLLDLPAVLEVAKETGKTPAQVLLKWNVQRGVAVIPKASSPEHLEENIKGLFDWRLTWDQKAKLDALETGKRFCDFEWQKWEDPEEGGAAKPSMLL